MTEKCGHLWHQLLHYSLQAINQVASVGCLPVEAGGSNSDKNLETVNLWHSLM